MCVVESLFLNVSGELNGLGQKASAMIFSMAALPVLFHEKSECLYDRISAKVRMPFPTISVVGRYSFGIYLIHAQLIHRVDVFGFSGDFKWAVLTLAVLLASLFSLVILHKVFPRASRLLLGV